jgi:hypothetical protein
MRYLVRKSVIDVIGRIWLPSVKAGRRITLSAYDVENAKDDDGQLTRESVEHWLCLHTGDFQSIIDFTASLEDGPNTVDIPWSNPNSELDDALLQEVE